VFSARYSLSSLHKRDTCNLYSVEREIYFKHKPICETSWLHRSHRSLYFPRSSAERLFWFMSRCKDINSKICNALQHFLVSLFFLIQRFNFICSRIWLVVRYHLFRETIVSILWLKVTLLRVSASLLPYSSSSSSFNSSFNFYYFIKHIQFRFFIYFHSCQQAFLIF